MSIRGMFSNINRALGSTTPQQRAQMLAIAGGSSPSPTMGNALYGQSQAIMQALQDEARLKAQAEQAEQDRRMRLSESELDRKLREREGKADRDLTSKHYDRLGANDDRRARVDEQTFSLNARKSQADLDAQQAALREQVAKWKFVQRVRNDPKATVQQKLMADLIEGGGNPVGAMYGGGGGSDFAAMFGGTDQVAPLSGADLVMQEMGKAAAAGQAPAPQPAAIPQQRIYAVPNTPGEYTFPQDQGLLRGLNPPLDARPR